MTTIIRFLHSDLGVTLSGLFAASLAIFGSDPLSTVIALLLAANLLLAFAINVRKLRRK
jgi:hypothetical protein